MLDDIERILREKGPLIEGEILKVIPRKRIKNLNDAVHYHFSTGGKRIRPVLAIMTCESLDGDVSKVLPFAAACELMHNWMLIHDDIEDGDTIRRNMETVWKKYGLAHGINIGDFISEKVYEIVMKSRDLGIDNETILRLINCIAETGIRTAEGQARDINLRDNNNPSECEYMEMIEGKTAYYLMMPIIGGAIIAGRDDDFVERIRYFGLKIGPAFQITDDLLDLTQGKGRRETGCDIKEGKRTLMVVHCSSKCSPAERKRLFQILNKSRERTKSNDIEAVKGLFQRYGSIDYARERANALLGEARELTQGMPERLGKILRGFSDYMVSRKR